MMKKLPKKFILKKESPKLPAKSPSNSRSFAEQNERGSLKAARKSPEQRSISKANGQNWLMREWKVLFVSFIAGMLLTAIGYTTYDIYQQIDVLNLQKEKKLVLAKEVEKWEKIVTSHPDYRDGYFQLALLEYQMGEKEKARLHLEKALQIDPNFEKARRLEKQFGMG